MYAGTFGSSPLPFLVYTGLIASEVFLVVSLLRCSFDFFRSCDRWNGVLFLILSFVLPPVAPFLVFACRHRDEGMPPRKQPAPPSESRSVAPEQPEIPVEEVPVEEVPAEEIPEEEAPLNPAETIEE